MLTNKRQQPGIRIRRKIQEELKLYSQMNYVDPMILDTSLVYSKLIKSIDNLFELVTNEPKSWENNEEASYI